MTKTKKIKDPKDYANENTIDTIKILEALEGANFEPVPIGRIIERSGVGYDKCRRVLITLELLGWAIQNERKEWTVGAKILRFSNRYSEICIATLNK